MSAIETERTLLRPFTAADAADVYAYTGGTETGSHGVDPILHLSGGEE